MSLPASFHDEQRELELEAAATRGRLIAELFAEHCHPGDEPDEESSACSWCNGHGVWSEYRHGTNPKDYPRHICRSCRCVCGAVLDRGVFHDDGVDGGQLCEACCPSCALEREEEDTDG